LFLCPACDPRAQGQERLESPFQGRLQVGMAVLRLRCAPLGLPATRKHLSQAVGNTVILVAETLMAQGDGVGSLIGSRLVTIAAPMPPSMSVVLGL